MSYQPDPAFAGLFRAFTGQADSIGGELTRALTDATAGQPLLVSTASDIAFFAGNGAPAQVESFRKSTRGFIELTACETAPLALAYVARLHEMEPAGTAWRARLASLVQQAQLTRAANSEALWRDQVALDAFAGIESKIAAMVEWTLASSVAYAGKAIADPSRLGWEALRRDYLERRDGPRSASMNDVMFATFCLAYIDIAYRIGNWLRGLRIDWRDAMVLVSGQSGRPTAGVSWSSNNICNLVWQASDKTLPPDRLFVAPHAPGFSVNEMPDPAGLAALEQTYRRLWCHTHAGIDVSRRMFSGQSGAFVFDPELRSDMPPIASIDDRDACVARLRRIMEDPTQLLSNCVADYVVAQLGVHGNRPQQVPVPGFTNLEFAAR